MALLTRVSLALIASFWDLFNVTRERKFKGKLQQNESEAIISLPVLQSKTFKRNSLLRKMSHQRKILSMLANLSQYIFSNAIATYQKLKYATRAKRKCLHMEICIYPRIPLSFLWAM